MNPTDRNALKGDHTPQAIADRLDQPVTPSYIGDAVLGAMDGCVTTFALVSGVMGAGFAGPIAIVLGSANLLADGLSMAVSNYQATRSEVDRVEEARADEHRHIRLVPEGEREEVRQIFAAKGFEGELLEQIVAVITSDPDLWVETMLREELGLRLDTPDPFRASLVTLAAFVLVGAIPLLPFALPMLFGASMFASSAVMTGVTFFAIGVLRGRLLNRPWLRSGAETLFLGGIASATAFTVGRYVQMAVGA